MDEPTHHLDIQAKQRLKEALLEYPGALIIISHDRDFLTGLTSRTLEFAGGKITEYLGDIDEMLIKKGIETLDLIAGNREKAKAVEASISSQKKLLDDQERKTLQKRFVQVEKQIEKLEQQLKEKEVQLADPQFYQSKDFQATVQVYESRKVELGKLMGEWEALAEKLSLG